MSFRLPLLAYPPGPRRAELLDTLLEAAEERGRRHPTPRQVFNLLHCGLRARLGHPRSRGIVVLATLIAVLAGVFGAAAVAPLGWRLAPSLPEGVAAEQLKRDVFPGLVAWGGGDAALWVRTADGEGEQYGFADYWVHHTAQTREVAAYTAEVRDRLAGQGWTIRGAIALGEPTADELPPAWHSASFWATRDGLALRFTDTATDKLAPWDSDGSAGFTLARTAPAGLWALEIAGALVAALLAWLLTGWVARRVEGRRFLQAGTLLTAVAGLVVLLPTVAFTMLWAAGNSDLQPPEQVWFVGQRGVLAVFWQPALVFACAMILLAVLPRRRVTAIGAAAAALALAVFAGRLPALVEHLPQPATAAAKACVPAMPAGGGARLSYLTYVFIRPATTPEQRNYIQAAISRIPGAAAFNFYYDPTSEAYREAYCHGGALPAGAGATLPYFWAIDLTSPGVYEGLAAEVGAMPGVVAVRPG
ncbi:hypothetical protein [Paractinoplanes toevensis]|uniref:Uncharacterized protein n=1 Tax=Paractinoplanes toevensis TaxID=571911 RepID=A0A919T7Q0_9ACTN|nr:hypothetical protein [Actinoplanes toevensis]GIM90540.1 hypothetical protein Ato02nite_023330 [Actinoplanes toevensis]